ncbi:MAG: type IV pilus twitching motility protein PilT [Planctomycetes bacterium]|nr:type IV pilus twitching motility protein PilT [Planctomycetota bacterium]
MAEIDKFFRILAETGGSDLHLSPEERPLIRLHGSLKEMEEGHPALSSAQIEALFEEIVPKVNKEEFAKDNDTDFAYEITGLARFRANIFRDRKGVGGVFRVIPSEILTAEALNLSPAILQLCYLTKGLVLVTGPTGSGKSTTLCAMIDYINRNRDDHIITIEDPIEFVHDNKRCLINQREVGVHTNGFKRALKAALREDPDIILVGEMRDLETIAIAIEMAETGHLVFGTLHTSTAPSTVDRIIDQFPAGQQNQIRTMLAESLKGVVAQTLCRTADGKGRRAALEILLVNSAVGSNIRDGKTHQIPLAMTTGRKLGMVSLNDALIELVKSGTVAAGEAYAKAVDKGALEREFERLRISFTKPGSEVAKGGSKPARPAQAAKPRPSSIPAPAKPAGRAIGGGGRPQRPPGQRPPAKAAAAPSGDKSKKRGWFS